MQGRGRLVQEQRLGIRHQRPRHRQHLPLPAAHRAGSLPLPLAQAGEQLVHGCDSLRRGRPCRASPFEVLLDREAREDVVELGDVAESPARDRVRLCAGDVLAPEEDPSPAWRQQSEDSLDQRGLARPVWAHHGDDFPLTDPHRDPVEDVHLGHISRDQILGREQEAVRCPPRSPPFAPVGPSAQ